MRCLAEADWRLSLSRSIVTLSRSTVLCSENCLTSINLGASWTEAVKDSDHSLQKYPQRNGFKSTGNGKTFLNTCENPYWAPLSANANTLVMIPRVSLTLSLTLSLKWGSSVLLKHIKNKELSQCNKPGIAEEFIRVSMLIQIS